MKKSNQIATLTFLIYLFFISSTAFADEVERTLAKEKFDVKDNALLEINHKFGKITCKNWDENAISVKVSATVKSSNNEKANKLLDKISVRIEGSQNGVSVESDFNEKIFNGRRDEVSVDIEIMMPENIRLELDHQFGSAYVEVVSGSSSIDCEYGSIEIKALKGDENDFEIGFGEARINYIHMGDVEVSYSSITIDEAAELSIESSYSTTSINKIDRLEIENEGGNAEVGRVNSIELSSKFSDFKIDYLEDAMDAETEYGSLRIKDIAANFSGISVENSFGAVDLYFDSQASFTIEASMEFCNLNYPKDKVQFSERIIESTDKYYKGRFGENANKGSLIIESAFGNVDINIK